jgi:hypothetical protein
MNFIPIIAYAPLHIRHLWLGNLTNSSMVTLIFFVLLKRRYFLYTSTLINTDCVSINTYFTHREVLVHLIVLLIKIYITFPNILCEDSYYNIPCFVVTVHNYRLISVALLWFHRLALTGFLICWDEWTSHSFYH